MGALALVTTASISLAGLGASTAAAATNPLQGKTVTMIIPHGAGGGFDTMARLAAQYIKLYAPVSSVVPENVTGGGGVIGDDQIWNSPRNGLYVGICDPDVMAENFDGNVVGVKYRPAQMSWLIGATSTSNVLVLSKKSPFYPLSHIKKGETIAVGAASSGDDLLDGFLMARALGLTARLVTGWSGGTAQEIPALSTGKPDAFVLDGDSAARAIADGYAVPLMQINLNRHPALLKIPLLLSRTPKSSSFYQAAVATTAVETADKAFCGPPMSPALTAEWRGIFNKVFANKSFIKKLEADDLVPFIRTGAEMQAHEKIAVKDGKDLLKAVTFVDKQVGQ